MKAKSERIGAKWTCNESVIHSYRTLSEKPGELSFSGAGLPASLTGGHSVACRAAVFRSWLVVRGYRAAIRTDAGSRAGQIARAWRTASISAGYIRDARGLIGKKHQNIIFATSL